MVDDGNMDLQSWPENSTYSAFSYYYYENYTDLIVPVEDEGLQFAGTVTAAFYSLIVFISLTGNSFLFWVLVKHRALGTSANLLLLHLTISDLVFTLTLVPWAVAHLWGWLFGELACKLFSGAIFLGFYSYMMFLTCMTVHRYMAVVHALRISTLDARRGRFYTHLTCIIVWAISAGCCLPEVIFSVTSERYDGELQCATNYSIKVELIASYSQIFAFFLLPFLVITFCYAKILITIWHCQIRNREHTVWLILFTVVGFFICWAPYNVAFFLNSLQLLEVPSMLTYEWKKALIYAYYVTHIMAYCHCCLNPLIQIFGGAKFRSYLPSRSSFRRMSERERSHTFSSQNNHFQTYTIALASM